LLVPTILDKIFVYPANSKTLLTEDQAFNHVPAEAGNNLIKADLYFVALA